MKIDRGRAAAIFRAIAAEIGEPLDESWVSLVRELGDAADTGARTHVAFVGTAMLAKAVDGRVDVHAVKAGAAGAGAYSARSLCHQVLVPLARELEINLGVTGREPLNNQPYFRIDRVDRSTPIHSQAKHTFQVVLRILEKLQDATPADAHHALRAFVVVRRLANPHYDVSPDARVSTGSALLRRVRAVTSTHPEHGRTAQAVAAGLMDIVFGPARVVVTRINDPDRHLPGDVGVKDPASSAWRLVLEVRDKLVRTGDVFAVLQKVDTAGVTNVGILAVSSDQPALPTEQLEREAAQRGFELRIFVGWNAFIREVIHWAPEWPRDATVRIRARLIQLEVSPAGVRGWDNAL